MGFKIWHLLVFVCLLLMVICLAGAGEKEKLHVVEIPELEGADTSLGSHVEIDPIGKSDELKFGNLTTFALTPEENILACDAEKNEIKLIDAAGKLLDTWKLDFAPYAIHSCRCGEVFASGVGVVAKFDKKGKVIKQVNSETAGFPDSKPSGIAVFGDNVFVAFGTGGSLRSRSKIVRFDRDLSKPVIIAEDMLYFSGFKAALVLCPG